MSAPFSTLLLDLDNWDLVIDSNNNIARADPPYALAQDVGSAIKTFLGEVWYDTTLGLPYFTKILGRAPPLALFMALMVDAALSVPGVTQAVVIVSSYDNDAEEVSGQVLFTDVNGNQQAIGF